MQGHSIIVIGASAGGVDALTRLVESLPSDLPAALFVVIHISPTAFSVLPEILRRRGKMPAFHAADNQPIELGHIYIAPPDRHLLVEKDKVRVTYGPRENRFRPAIDPLFRSAASAYGREVVGVILSGALDDGTAGLQAIKQAGGIAVVQDPDEALYPDMPRSAIENVPVDYVLPLAEIGAVLVELAEDAAAVEEKRRMSDQQILDEKEVRGDMAAQERGERGGEPSVYTCPDCGGVLWEMDDHGLLRFRCHVGHAYSMESMEAAQNDKLEAALWTAVRALEENASLSRRLRTRMEEHRSSLTADRFAAQAAEAERHADVIREMLRHLSATATATEEAVQLPEVSGIEP